MSSHKRLGFALALVEGVCLLGLALAALISALELDRTDQARDNIFYYLYSHYEPWNLVLLLLLAALFHLSLRRTQWILPAVDTLERLWPRLSPKAWLGTLAAGVVILCWVGAVKVYQQFPFSMDEYTVRFQAQILAAGHFTAPVGEPWRFFEKGLTPLFVSFLSESNSWVSDYLPVYAALLAPFVLLGVPGLLNPLLAAGSLLAVVGIARNIWPERMADRVLVAVLLAASPQFLITAMSGYSMPAHLFFNLVWLWLYTGQRRVGLLIAPWVGLVAMGLHAFVPHALFAIPFLLRILRRRQWWVTIYFATVYLAASALWIFCQWYIHPNIGDEASSHLGLPTASEFLNLGANLAQIVSWQPLAFGVLICLGLTRWQRFPAILRDLAWSALGSLLFYLILVSGEGQGHGWGARYIHPVLGNLVILAVPGWHLLNRMITRTRALSFVAATLAFALLVQLPLRATQVVTMIRPFVATQEYIAALDDTIVVVHEDVVWYGQDVIRNDPFLADTTKVLFLNRLTREQLDGLASRWRVRVLTPAELAGLGMFLTTEMPMDPPR